MFRLGYLLLDTFQLWLVIQHGSTRKLSYCSMGVHHSFSRKTLCVYR
jgi:hypothetical protein